MPETKSTNSTITLRRSPRFLHEDPKTPELKKTRPLRFTSSPLNASAPKVPNKCDKNPTTSVHSRGPVKSSKDQAKSARNDLDFVAIEKRVTRNSAKNQVDVCNLEEGSCEKVGNSSKKKGKGKAVVVGDRFEQCDGNIANRASCSLARRKNNQVAEGRKRDEQCVGDTEKRVSRSSKERQLNRVAKCRKKDEQCAGDTEKKVTRSSNERKLNQVSKSRKRDDECAGNIEERVSTSQSNSGFSEIAKGRKASSEAAHKKAVIDGGKDKSHVEFSSPSPKKRNEKECVRERADVNEECERKTLIGEKRKRSRVDKKTKIVLGWTEQQETALGRAYFTAKPTPHFWKKVAKMVPGKSAQECFERIHSDHQTPPQPCTRSMSRTKPSLPTFSASKLLGTANTKTKKLTSTKRNCLLARKTVRQLLEKQQNVEKDHETDLFSVLEPTVNPCSLSFGSPVLSRSPTSSPMSLSRSSSAQKKPLSRLSGCSSAVLVSPPVLKQVKNKALHEKYIDQLHFRDAKRKADSLRRAKSSQATNDNKTRNSEKNAVQVAKDALMFEAQDAMLQYRNSQSSLINESFDFMDDSHQSDQDEF